MTSSLNSRIVGDLYGVQISFFSPMRFDGVQVDRFIQDPLDINTVSDGAFWGDKSKYFEDSSGKIWLIYATGENLDCYDPNTEKFRRFRSRLIEGSGKDAIGRIRDVFEDSEQNVWIGCGIGIFKYFPLIDSLTFFSLPGNTTVFFEDNKENIWLNYFKDYSNNTLARINADTGVIEEWIDYPIKLKKFPDYLHFYHQKEGDSIVHLLINEKLFEFNSNSKNISYLHEEILEEQENVISIWGDNKEMLIGTESGKLIRYYFESKKMSEFVSFNEEGLEYVISYPFNLFRSKDGVTWVKVVKGENEFPNFQFFPSIVSVQKSNIPNDIIPWEEDEYLLKYNGQVFFFSGSGFRPVRPDISNDLNLDNLIQGIPLSESFQYVFETTDKGDLWMLAKGQGEIFIRKINKKGEIKFSFYNNKPNNWSYPGGIPIELEIDENEKLWIATHGKGLLFFDPATNAFQDFGSKIHPLIKGSNAILVDSENNIWCGTGSMLSKLNQVTGEIKHFGVEDHSQTGPVMTIFEDSVGSIWVGTLGGLFKVDKDGKILKIYRQSDGINPGQVYNVFEDSYKQLWVTKNELLCLYDKKNDAFFAFDYQEGVEMSEVDHHSDNLIDNDGYMFFPSSGSEVYYFKPEKMNWQPEPPGVHFTDFELFNSKVKPEIPNGILKSGLDFTQEIELTFDQNDFTIHYTSPEYKHPDKIEYSVKMVGFNNGWQQWSKKRDARFTGLSPGEYVFNVKAQNHFRVESQIRTLKITILPPWYRTWWACTLWAIFAFGGIYWFYRFQLNRKLAESEARRLKELNDAKNVLYTNITHEFRTPLTVILGMIDQMKADPKNWFSEGASLIRRNGKQLLNLVNQMLDLSKLESGSMPLNMVQGDVVSYLRYLSESFHSYADSKDIRLHFRSDFANLKMDHDPEKLQNIVSNLLSNAIKFTPAGGDVYFDLRRVGIEKSGDEATELLLQVSDTGTGITAEHLPNIFDRFYQADSTNTRRGEGTGIGLALTRELVQVLGGNIQVESEIGAGTQFKIWLPVKREAKVEKKSSSQLTGNILSETVIILPVQSHMAQLPEQNDKNTVLLVEDNPDVLTYLMSILSTHYQVVTASNGQAGIDTAKEVIPDLIVSDVMMPEKDGFELCDNLKTDERTSHIPIILLTAKADQRSKIEGLSHRADAYLSKPFHQEELLVRLEKLIELRKSLQKHYQEKGALRRMLLKKTNSQEDSFLKRVVEIIESEMSDENFGMPQLCKALRMTRTTLFRKLKALTGKSASNLIRTIRLEKARELLEQTEKTVSEVCFEVGFNNPAYFSTMFKEEFGLSPSEVKK